MRTTSLIPLAAVLAAAALPATAGAALPGTVVLHQKDFQDEFSQLYLARADGSSGMRELTTPDSAPDPSACWNGGCGAEAPEWTPDGARVFFDSSWTPFIHTWSVAADGSDPVMEPARHDFEGEPSVSASQLAISIGDGLTGDIVVRDRATGAERHLTTGPRDGFDANPDLSPDGSSIVFQRFHQACPKPDVCPGRDYRAEIWAVDADGTHLRRLLSGGRVWGDPHHSPDGTKILVHAYDDRGTQGANSNQFTIRPDGSHLTQLTNRSIGSASFSGDWSPDGQHIVYVSYTRGDDHLEIRSMSASGKDESLIAECDPMLFCDVPNWGVYAGPLPAAPALRAGIASASRHHASRRAVKRFARRLVRQLARG